tara:strand:- start:229 stop:489 length:261 start_codon:yes stop_codon:yes gene_type:complete
LRCFEKSGHCSGLREITVFLDLGILEESLKVWSHWILIGISFLFAGKLKKVLVLEHSLMLLLLFQIIPIINPFLIFHQVFLLKILA